MEAIALETKFHDHLLLTLQVVINGTPLCALMDNGATRSFIDEKLQFHPPFKFIGVCFSLEMASGDTRVLTRVAQ